MYLPHDCFEQVMSYIIAPTSNAWIATCSWVYDPFPFCSRFGWWQRPLAGLRHTLSIFSVHLRGRHHLMRLTYQRVDKQPQRHERGNSKFKCNFLKCVYSTLIRWWSALFIWWELFCDKGTFHSLFIHFLSWVMTRRPLISCWWRATS